MILSMFLGFGLGRGSKVSSRIKSGEIKLTHQIIFTDESSKNIKIVGQNSSYIFYVVENEKEVTISPIVQNIKEIKRINGK